MSQTQLSQLSICSQIVSDDENTDRDISTQAIHRFNIKQGAVPEKSRQWIDENCPCLLHIVTHE